MRAPFAYPEMIWSMLGHTLIFPFWCWFEFEDGQTWLEVGAWLLT